MHIGMLVGEPQPLPVHDLVALADLERAGHTGSGGLHPGQQRARARLQAAATHLLGVARQPHLRRRSWRGPRTCRGRGPAPAAPRRPARREPGARSSGRRRSAGRARARKGRDCPGSAPWISPRTYSRTWTCLCTTGRERSGVMTSPMAPPSAPVVPTLALSRTGAPVQGRAGPERGQLGAVSAGSPGVHPGHPVQHPARGPGRAARRRPGRRPGRRTRSVNAAATGSWVTITTVCPNSSTERRSSVSTSAPERESRLPVGSSANTIEGRLASARATATRCCWPPESSLGRCLSRSPEARRRRSRCVPVRVRLAARDGQRQHDVLLARSASAPG